jgi:hypothetical protein
MPSTCWLLFLQSEVQTISIELRSGDCGGQVISRFMAGTIHAEIIRSYSASQKDMAVGIKNLKFGLIKTKDRFQTVLCS